MQMGGSISSGRQANLSGPTPIWLILRSPRSGPMRASCEPGRKPGGRDAARPAGGGHSPTRSGSRCPGRPVAPHRLSGSAGLAIARRTRSGMLVGPGFWMKVRPLTISKVSLFIAPGVARLHPLRRAVRRPCRISNSAMH